MSEQRFHEVRVRFQYERQRHGFYRAAVVFSCRRARRAVRFAAQDAFVAAFDRWDAHHQRVAAERAVIAAESVAALEKSLRVWGASVGV